MVMDVSQLKFNLIIEGVFFDDIDVNIFDQKFGILFFSFKILGIFRVGGFFDGEIFSGLVLCVGFVEDKMIDCFIGCYDVSIWFLSKFFYVLFIY